MKVEVAVLGSPSLISPMVHVDVKQLNLNLIQAMHVLLPGSCAGDRIEPATIPSYHDDYARRFTTEATEAFPHSPEALLQNFGSEVLSA